ncbi:MAG TPA: DUF1016 N-terminal domain-containing protein [Opitutus sp.]|nr:DUF1016 N-terminal domain-containing protein [Opitutus sp.]
MPSRAPALRPKTYAQLRAAVVTVVVNGRREIDRAWLETYAETGRLINEHVLPFRDRAGYGARIYEKLAADTGISERTLRQCSQFYRFYPIRSARSELGWGHYRLLIQIDDGARRKTIETEAIRKHWTTRDLETRVRAFNAVALAPADPAPAQPAELLTPRRGTPGLHPIVDLGDGLAIDLGFKFYRRLDATSKLRPDDIVQFDPSASPKTASTAASKVAAATTTDLFTYAATVRKIVDGDTLDIALAIAPGFEHQLKLRLRGLDCPEMSTAAGRAAKAFVDALIGVGDTVIVSTTKPDKYDRYLADVFVGGNFSQLSANDSQLKSPSQLSTLKSQPGADSIAVFLNNALLESGHAIRYDGGAKE